MINKLWDLTEYCWEEPGHPIQDYGAQDMC